LSSCSDSHKPFLPERVAERDDRESRPLSRFSLTFLLVSSLFLMSSLRALSFHRWQPCIDHAQSERRVSPLVIIRPPPSSPIRSNAMRSLSRTSPSLSFCYRIYARAMRCAVLPCVRARRDLSLVFLYFLLLHVNVSKSARVLTTQCAPEILCSRGAVGNLEGGRSRISQTRR